MNDGQFILLRAGQADHANDVGPKRARRSRERVRRAFDSFGEWGHPRATLDQAVRGPLAVNERLADAPFQFCGADHDHTHYAEVVRWTR